MNAALQLDRLSPARPRPIPHGGAFFFNNRSVETEDTYFVLNIYFHSDPGATGTRASDRSLSERVISRLTTSQARLREIPHGGAFFSNREVIETKISSYVLNNFFHSSRTAAPR
jgi:hypothetical protein